MGRRKNGRWEKNLKLRVREKNEKGKRKTEEKGQKNVSLQVF
mgnify:CR=1 FL=1